MSKSQRQNAVTNDDFKTFENMEEVGFDATHAMSPKHTRGLKYRRSNKKKGNKNSRINAGVYSFYNSCNGIQNRVSKALINKFLETKDVVIEKYTNIVNTLAPYVQHIRENKDTLYFYDETQKPSIVKKIF